MGSDSCPQEHFLPHFLSLPRPGGFSLLVWFKFRNTFLLVPLALFERWHCWQGKSRVSKAFFLGLASPGKGDADVCKCRSVPHLLSEIHHESTLTPQESAVSWLCPLVPWAAGRRTGRLLLDRSLTAHVACFPSANEGTVPKERAKDGNLPGLKNPIICLLNTDLHTWKDDYICRAVNVKCHLSWMDYISDMSSEARPGSLPAVVVKAGLPEGDACASLSWRADWLPWDWQREGVMTTDVGATPPKGWMKKRVLFKCILLKGFTCALCLSYQAEVKVRCAVSGDGGLPIGRNWSSEPGWMWGRVWNKLSQSFMVDTIVRNLLQLSS